MAPVAIESSHCKLFETTRAWDTLYDAMQVAGGAGYLSTQPYEKRMRGDRMGPSENQSLYDLLDHRQKSDLNAIKSRIAACGKKPSDTESGDRVIDICLYFDLGICDDGRQGAYSCEN